MSAEHRRPFIAFLAVVALALAIVSSGMRPGTVRVFLHSTPGVVSDLSPDTFLGPALAVAPDVARIVGSGLRDDRRPAQPTAPVAATVPDTGAGAADGAMGTVRLLAPPTSTAGGRTTTTGRAGGTTSARTKVRTTSTRASARAQTRHRAAAVRTPARGVTARVPSTPVSTAAGVAVTLSPSGKGNAGVPGSRGRGHAASHAARPHGPRSTPPGRRVQSPVVAPRPLATAVTPTRPTGPLSAPGHRPTWLPRAAASRPAPPVARPTAPRAAKPAHARPTHAAHAPRPGGPGHGRGQGAAHGRGRH